MRAVETFKTNDTDIVYWDGELTGFGIRVRKSGQKNYVLQTQVRGELRWFTIGQHGLITDDEARAAALDILAQTKKGIDPCDADAKRKTEPNLSDATPLVPTPTAVSLFSNCGAGDVGFATAGFHFRLMAELVVDRLEVALRNHKNAKGIQGDLRKTWQDVVDQWCSLHGSAAPTLVAACPPCQGMSTARSNRGAEDDPDAGSRDDRNLLVLPISHIVKALAPTFVVVENVTAFLSRMVREPQSGEALSAARLLVRLLADDYDVYPFLTDLADFGVPQRRKRAFLTFVRRNSHASEILQLTARAPYPVPTHAPDYGANHIPVNAALVTFGLPSLDAGNPVSAKDSDRPLHFVPVWSEHQHQMVAAIPPGSGASAWDNNQCPLCGTVETDEESVECPSCGKPLLRPVVLEDTGPRLVRGFRRASYRRMESTRPAATITTASGRIGSSRTIHPFENRVMSPLECALLQTIPEDFDWGDVLKSKGVSELRAMIGEAVPPLFTTLHGLAMVSLLSDRTDHVPLIPLNDIRCRSAQRRLGFY